MRQPPSLLLFVVVSAGLACADTPSAPPGTLAAPGAASASLAAAPARTSTVDHVLFFVRGGPPMFPALSLSSPASTLLWDRRGHQPVIAPDGHQVTLGEWITPTGRASVKCIEGGTHTVLHYSDLLPNATYTVWQLAFASPGFQGSPGANLIAIGALGPNDGSGNVFHTSAAGEGELSAVTPAGPLSIMGSLGACALDEFEVHYVAAYHFDGQTWGRFPGPAGTFAEQAGVRFLGH